MLRRLFLCLLLPVLLPAEDHWTALKSGPFQVWTNAGDRAARDKLMFLEQFREAVRILTGKQDIHTTWPIRVLVFKSGNQLPASPKAFTLARDTRVATLTESGSFSRDEIMELARILLYDNTSRLPQNIEEGLIELLSTLEVAGTRVTLGAPVPVKERSPGWALLHLVTVNPDYAGRARVMISNLEQSGDFDAACSNAFQKSATQINQQADAYLKAGNFGTTQLSGRAIGPRDFKIDPLTAEDPKIALADLLLASGSPEAKAAYTALKGPASFEGQGIILLREHKENEARPIFQSAIEADSPSARAWLELGLLEAGPANAVADYKRASELNPRWAEPHFHMADDEDDPVKRSAFIKKAALLEPRNIDYWQALARSYIVAKNYTEAQKAWGGAERAAATETERARIHQVRLQVEADRVDNAISERKRENDDREKDLQRVKALSEASIHAAEEAARKRLNPNGAAPPTAEGWYQAPQSDAKVEGEFQRLDCLGKRARMVIQTADGKAVQLLVSDANQVVISGGGEKALSCGPQKPVRKVSVDYKATADAKMKTSGEAVSIDFH